MAVVFMRKIFSHNHYFRLSCDSSLFLLVFKQYSAVAKPSPHYLYFNSGFDNGNDKSLILTDMKVYENFITQDEEKSLLEELEPHLKRKRYERDHWDNAILGYREIQRVNWNTSNLEIINRIKKFAFDPKSVPLKHVHILDLEENGVIKPHIDNVEACGTTIAGVSLLSDSVMRLVHDKDKQKIVDILLKRFSLYVMTDSARYNYTHEILGNDVSEFNSQVVKKSRRISVIFRNEP